ARRNGYRITVEPRAKVWHKVSSSFESGSRGAHYQYYFTRGRLLWIEKNLTGRAKISAFMRCLKDLYSSLQTMRNKGVLEQDYLISRARLLGGAHYIIRKFGLYQGH